MKLKNVLRRTARAIIADNSRAPWMAMLRKQDPELARRVADEELTLDQAR